MMANNYEIPCNSISIRNPQENTIVESVHQTIGIIIHTFTIHQMDLDNENPWEGILSSTMFAIWSLVHTTTQHILSQLVFGRDTILNINQEANLQFIRMKIAVGKLMCTTPVTKSYLRTTKDQHIGPYTMTEVWNNGTVCTSIMGQNVIGRCKS